MTLPLPELPLPKLPLPLLVLPELPLPLLALPELPLPLAGELLSPQAPENRATMGTAKTNRE
jgi:hypothetical protein